MPAQLHHVVESAKDRMYFLMIRRISAYLKYGTGKNEITMISNDCIMCDSACTSSLVSASLFLLPLAA